MSDEIREEVKRAREERRRRLVAQLAGKKSAEIDDDNGETTPPSPPITHYQGDDAVVGGGLPTQKKRSLIIIRRKQQDEESDSVDDTWGTSSDEEADAGEEDEEEELDSEDHDEPQADGWSIGAEKKRAKAIAIAKAKATANGSGGEGAAAPERGVLRISKSKVQSGKVVETAVLVVPPDAQASFGPPNDETEKAAAAAKENAKKQKKNKDKEKDTKKQNKKLKKSKEKETKKEKKLLSRSDEVKGQQHLLKQQGSAVAHQLLDPAENPTQFSVSASAVPLLPGLLLPVTIDALDSASQPLSAGGAAKREKKGKKAGHKKLHIKPHSIECNAIREEEASSNITSTTDDGGDGKKKTTHIAALASLSQTNSPVASPPMARPSRPMSAYAALPSSALPSITYSPPSSLPASRSSSRPSSGYASCASPLAYAAPIVSLSLSAAELASSSTMLPPLTDDCAMVILSYLRPGELCKAALVDRSWHRLASEDSLWAGFLTDKIRARRDPSLGGWKQYFKLAWRRSKVATEILTTEQSYVRSLQRVVELFIVPLRDKGNEQVITAEERKALFSEIEVILGLNTSLLSELEQRMTQWSFDQCLGDIFKQFTSFLKVYTSYINNFDNSITTLAKLKQSNDNFSAYLSYAESRKECHGLQINSFLVMPVQRIPRYVLLLKDFLKHTPEDHDDHANVNKALTDMQQVAAYIEKKKEEAENIYHIMAIQDSLVGKFNTIVVPGRKYKFEGALSEAIMSSKRTKRRTEGYYCFLFNDLFVVAKRKGIISHIKKITAKRLRPGSKGSTWNNTALYSTPFGSSESTEGVRFDFVKQIPISATTTSIERVSAEEAAEFGMEVDLSFKVISAEDEEASEPPIFAAPNEKELSRWLQAFEGCISCTTPRSADAYIRIERSRSASTSDDSMKKKRNSTSYTSAKKPSFLKRMSVGPSTSLNNIITPSSPSVAPAAQERAASSPIIPNDASLSSSSGESSTGGGSRKKSKKDKKTSS